MEDIKSKASPIEPEKMEDIWRRFLVDKGFDKSDSKDLAQMRHDVFWFNRWLLERRNNKEIK